MSTQSAQYRIDDKVIPFMLGVSFIFLILMAFRFKNDEPCQRVQFGFTTANNNNAAYDREKIYFSSQIKFNASKWEWDFGDNTTDKTSGPDVTHEYATPGDYTVKLTINGKCTEVRNISIARREKSNNKIYLRPVWPPEKLVAGKEYYFGDSTAGASDWTWYFGDDEIKYTKQNLVYQFVEPGEYKVVLLVGNESGNRSQAERTFQVAAPPVIKSPIVRGVPDISRPRSGGSDPIPTIPNYPDDNGDIGKSIPERLTDANKPPTLADGFLVSYILDINGNGGNALKKYLKNGSLSNCIIIFNSHPVTPDQLKENIRAHNEHPKSLTAKSETDPKENYIKVITITAEMEPRDRMLGKDKPRKYPN